MKKQGKKFICLLLAACMTLSMTLFVFAEEESHADPAAGAGREDALLHEDPNGYMVYRKTKYAPIAESLSLDLTKGKTEQVSTAEDGGYLMAEKGKITCTFTLKEDALFEAELAFAPVFGRRHGDQISILLDGKAPFTEAANLLLPQIWRDAEKIRQDLKGNDLIPKQEERFEKRAVRLRSDTLFVNENLQFSLPAGEHTLTLCNEGEALTVYGLRLLAPIVYQTSEELAAANKAAGLKEIPGVLLKQQAEESTLKSTQSVFPQYDRTTPSTEPYHVSKIRRNVLGKNSWADRGDWVTWTIRDVPEDGLYYITLKFRQNEQNGGTVYRMVEINGQVPCAEMSAVPFDYQVSWQRKTLSDKQGKAIAVPLKKGDNEIKLTGVLGSHEKAYQMVQETVALLSRLYIQMVMICGSNPDPYQDYHLETDIPDLVSTMEKSAELLEKSSEELRPDSKKKSAETASLDRSVSQLRGMLKKPETIPTRLSAFRDTISTLSDWLYTTAQQPLTLDYLLVHSADAELPSPKATFFEELAHQFKSFFASFVEDYNTMSGTAEDGKEAKVISVWANTGRDQIQQMYDMIRDDFTPKTGISVHLSLVQAGFIEATLAGAGPDIALGVARGQPVNLACRDVLTDLSKFPDFDEVAKRFSDTACVPYMFDGGVYALPNTQAYFMMFYREDVLNSLGIALPQTWEDVQATISRLQKKNMTFGLPYTVISAAAAVDLGMGAKDMFGVLLLQSGGRYYQEDAMSADLSTEEAEKAFTTWCSFYTDYGFDLIYDFYTRFRYGEMPIGIASFEMYNTLTAAAPEIRGLWKMAPVPGTRKPDGSIDRTIGGAGTGTILFNKAEDPDACWSFMKWWTKKETQVNYGTQVENILGPAGRYSTATTEAFQELAWTQKELDVLNEQRKWVQEIEEIPGSYFVSRCLDNAFRAVLYDDKTPLEIFEIEVDNINREITRKRKELKLPVREEA